MRKYNYKIMVTIRGDVHTINSNNLMDCSTSINSLLGYDFVSKHVLINWMCRKKKSGRYDFIDIKRSRYSESESESDDITSLPNSEISSSIKS